MPLLFANPRRQVFSRQGSYNGRIRIKFNVPVMIKNVLPQLLPIYMYVLINIIIYKHGDPFIQ